MHVTGLKLVLSWYFPRRILSSHTHTHTHTHTDTHTQTHTVLSWIAVTDRARGQGRTAQGRTGGLWSWNRMMQREYPSGREIIRVGADEEGRREMRGETRGEDTENPGGSMAPVQYTKTQTCWASDLWLQDRERDGAGT